MAKLREPARTLHIAHSMGEDVFRRELYELPVDRLREAMTNLMEIYREQCQEIVSYHRAAEEELHRMMDLD